MHVDCTLISEELKKYIKYELSNILQCTPDEIQLFSINFELSSFTLNLNELEKTTLIKALSRSSGNISKTARFLGVSRKTVYALIKKHQLVSFINIIE